MKKLILIIFPILLNIFLLTITIFPGTTGKISGIITDKMTGEPLVGASIVIEGTVLGAATDFNGQYTILHIPPGTYSLQFSYVGYRQVKLNDVRVNIDQTTRINLEMDIEAVEVDELVVVAERNIIKPDVATSVVAVTSEEISNLPVSSVSDVVSLQAGIRDMNIRGGGGEKILFMMDGVTLRDPRNNNPTTQIALSSIKEISIERGGFNAEYGQVRSGIINVVTREGERQKYSGSLQIRMSPPSRKYSLVDGNYDIHHPMSYVLRPFFDDAVAWEGTGNGAWDEYTTDQYPQFDGWNEVSRVLNTDNDPNNDLTPLGAQRVFMYEIRKNLPTNEPDYNIDAGFGGPVPYVSEMLGYLRFYASFRQTRNMLVWPLSRPDYRDYDATLQVTSDISQSMKLKFSGLYGQQFTIRHNWDATGTGSYYYPRYPNEIADVASFVGGAGDLITLFSDFNFALTDITHRSLAAKFTHTISSETFYEVSVENFWVDYFTRPSPLRDTSKKYEIIDGFYEDSNPLGYWPYNSYGVIIKGGSHVAKARDFSTVSTTTVKADLTSQVNFQNLVKIGAEFNYNNLDFDYGTVSNGVDGPTYDNRVQMNVFPFRAAIYVQDKLETEEFILNAGLRLDYSNSNTDWYAVAPFDFNFISRSYNDDLEFTTKKSEGQWQLSPRLGIAHPITEFAKLFFNYGHFKQVPQYESLFRIQRTQDKALSSFGNPNITLAKTISYELGFDFSLNDEYLLQIAGYYQDIEDQQDYILYESKVSGLSYNYTVSNNYQDIRGFEITLRKFGGRWFSGFANYTYSVSSTGNFGSTRIIDVPQEQEKWDQATVNLYADRPIPRPYARLNMTFFTPNDFGPEILGHHLFGDILLNILFDWQAGGYVTWNNSGLPGISYNVEEVDYFNTNLRLDKTINIGAFNVSFFMDITNVFNTLRLWNRTDYNYLSSLHLPKSDAYGNMPGDDKVGDYREPGTEYQPMIYQNIIDRTKSGKERPIYYEEVSGGYFEYKNGIWSQVDQARVDKVLKDKAYIDMPNASTFWFLNPRNFYFGVRLSFNI